MQLNGKASALFIALLVAVAIMSNWTEDMSDEKLEYYYRQYPNNEKLQDMVAERGLDIELLEETLTAEEIAKLREDADIRNLNIHQEKQFRKIAEYQAVAQTQEEMDYVYLLVYYYETRKEYEPWVTFETIKADVDARLLED